MIFLCKNRLKVRHNILQSLLVNLSQLTLGHALQFHSVPLLRQLVRLLIERMMVMKVGDLLQNGNALAQLPLYLALQTLLLDGLDVYHNERIVFFAGRAIPPAQPHTEFTITNVVPGRANASSTASGVVNCS